ncbi:MAG TPA: D-glycerate dehydrogenase, partial [Thermoplasmatales archaeon]|nr:D-glycerate dehydrogenase [Thermoplasmatales archaeon]
YYNRSRNEVLEEKLGARKVDLETLLRESDFISIHLPLTKETHHLIDYDKICLMKRDSIIVNTARGAVIKEKDLVRALKERKIFGAGLDVYENEPEVSEELKSLDNVVLLPHIGSATLETRTEMAVLAAENLVKALKGERPRYCVNPEVLKD